MDGILTLILSGAAALVFVAIVVAWWEHLGRQAARAEENEGTPGAPSRRAVTVDVELDMLTPPEPADLLERRRALDEALDRAERRSNQRRVWVDTAPMVGPGLADAAEAGHERSASRH